MPVATNYFASSRLAGFPVIDAESDSCSLLIISRYSISVAYELSSKRHPLTRLSGPNYLALRLRLSPAAMFMLRKGGKFTDSQIDRHFSEVLRVCIIGAVIFIVIAMVGFPKIGLLAAILVVCSAKGSFRRFENWSKGKRGEIVVAEALKSLSNSYVLLNDLTLPDGKGNVDHLVVAPNGLFVIETKNYSGRVKCEGDQWFVNGRPSRSVSRQAKRNAMAVRNHLGTIFAERQRTNTVRKCSSSVRRAKRPAECESTDRSRA